MLRHVLTAVLLATTARALPAQDAAEVCEAIADISLGDWVEYRMSGAGMMGPMGGEGGEFAIRYAIVDHEEVNGTEHWWLEMKMDSPMGEAIIQFLVPAWPYNSGDVQAMVMKMGDTPARRMPASMMEMMRGQMPENPSMQAAERCGDGEVIGWENVTVPAGTFRALHVRPTAEGGVNTEVWVSMDVPFGMVKVTMTGDEGGEIVLAGHGTGATSSITETPQGM